MATKYDESSRKTYNNKDSNEQLMYVEVTKNTFAGYRRELLVYSLSEVETDFYVCTECKGVMRNACLVGEEQNLVCEVCVKEGVLAIPMVKSRNKIFELQAKCPIATRGCNWNGKIAEVEEHLIICEKVVVKCTNACDVILPKSELGLHLTFSCMKRRVTCEHCNQYCMYKELTNHYQSCLDYQVPCPNNCNANLKQKLLDSHLELECPNTVVKCPYKKFGCRQEVFRRDLEEHKKTNQIEHLEFATCEIEQLKQTNIHLTKTNMQLMARVTTLENEVHMSLCPIILCDETTMPFAFMDRLPSVVIKKVNWRCKLSVGFQHNKNNNFITVFVRMENDNKAPLVNWPFEGRFKLTVIDKYESYTHKSEFTKLQPKNVLKDKGCYPSEVIIAEIPFEQASFPIAVINFKYILQIQEIENL